MPVYKRNVSSVAKSGSSKLKGDITLTEGTGVTLSQSGQDIEIAASGGSGDVATDTIWDAKGDLAVGTGADTADNLPVGTDGQVLTADSSKTTGLKWASASSGGTGITWAAQTSSFTADVNNGYICNSTSLIVVTLPSTATVGSIVEVAYLGSGGWKIAQTDSVSIQFGNKTTTVGTSGSISSTGVGDAIRLVCITADTGWSVLSSVGNLGIV